MMDWLTDCGDWCWVRSTYYTWVQHEFHSTWFQHYEITEEIHDLRSVSQNICFGMSPCRGAMVPSLSWAFGRTISQMIDTSESSYRFLITAALTLTTRCIRVSIAAISAIRIPVQPAIYHNIISGCIASPIASRWGCHWMTCHLHIWLESERTSMRVSEIFG